MRRWSAWSLAQDTQDCGEAVWDFTSGARAHFEDLLTWCSACERCGLLVVVQSALRVRLSEAEGLLHAASFLLVVVPD